MLIHVVTSNKNGDGLGMVDPIATSQFLDPSWPPSGFPYRGSGGFQQRGQLHFFRSAQFTLQRSHRDFNADLELARLTVPSGKQT